MTIHHGVSDAFSCYMPCADGRKTFPFAMVGGVLDFGNGWDIRKPLVKKVMELFPGAQAIVPKVRTYEHSVLQSSRTSLNLVFRILHTSCLY